MKILAIDQSLTESGYWINDEENGLIKTSSKEKKENRLKKIRDEVFSLLESKPDVVVMEDYSYGASNTKFTFTAGEVGGTIKLVVRDVEIPMIIVTPTLLKKFISGKGVSKKEQMLMYCLKKYDREFTNNNLCDAFCLNQFIKEYYQWKLNDRLNFTNTELDCFKKLEVSNEERKI